MAIEDDRFLSCPFFFQLNYYRDIYLTARKVGFSFEKLVFNKGYYAASNVMSVCVCVCVGGGGGGGGEVGHATIEF